MPPDPIRFGAEITRALLTLLEGVREGAEDPILAELLGPELSDLVRRRGWNTLVLNPGSTSTKLAVYYGLKLLGQAELQVERAATAEARAEGVLAWMRARGFDPLELTGVAARGGMMAPVQSGTYRICSEMLADLSRARFSHPANLAAAMAHRIAQAVPDLLLTTTDPVVVDEIEPVHRLTGSAVIRTNGSAVHYLNHRAVALLTARTLGRPLEDLHLVTCHLGGGASAARHRGGRVLQVVSAYGGLPSANRAGALPLGQVLDFIDERKYDLEALRAELTRSGGLVALAGTDDFRAVLALARAETGAQSEKARLVIEFFASQIAAAVLALSADPRPLDAIVLTGGLARDEGFAAQVALRIHLGVPLARLPGALEHPALAAGLLRGAADHTALFDYREVRDRVAAERALLGEVLDTPLFEPVAAARKGPPRSLEDLLSRACASTPPLIALVGADNDEALLAVKQAVEHGGTSPLARFVLLGPYEPVVRLAWELDVPIDEQTVYAVDTPDPVAAAVSLLNAGAVDTLMKGSASTADVLKGYLKHYKSRQKGESLRLSHLALFELPGRPKLVGLTDAAMNTYPDIPGRIGILENALIALRHIGFEQLKVAVISATEKPSQAVTSSVEAQAIAAHFTGRPGLCIEGPLSVDLALSPEAARDKHYKGQIQGDADLLLVPDIDTGNAIYKTFTVASKADAAGVVIGGPRPVILTSRGDTARTKLSAIALAVLLTQSAAACSGGSR